MLELPRAEVLLVVPPFGRVDFPSLGLHQLQACLRAGGYEARIYYANLAFAQSIGTLAYDHVNAAPIEQLTAEQIFASVAFPENHAKERVPLRLSDNDEGRVFDAAAAFAAAFGHAVQQQGHRFVGCTASVQQTTAALALLRAAKVARPPVKTLLGGANCEHPMGAELARIAPFVDHVFSGESEHTLPDVIRALDTGGIVERVVAGTACENLDSLPSFDFDDYYEALARAGVDPAASWLAYESSRGCWWGAKHHCTFCGLNGTQMGSRVRSPERVLADLRRLACRHPCQRVLMADNIMPHNFHEQLIPRLRREAGGARLFYEAKANLQLRQVVALAESGVAWLQPGIESLSPSVLRLFRKGVRVDQNIALLRYARATGLRLEWNLLFGVPGDPVEDYHAMLKLIPKLAHLQPPGSLSPVMITRYSPYFNSPEQHGITHLRPLDGYKTVFPPTADLQELAFHFTGDFASGSLDEPSLVDALARAVAAWTMGWERTPRATLHAIALDAQSFLLTDTRPCAERTFLRLDRDQTAAVLIGGDRDCATVQWALQHGYCVEVDQRIVPLATAPVLCLANFEALRPLRKVRLGPPRSDLA